MYFESNFFDFCTKYTKHTRWFSILKSCGSFCSCHYKFTIEQNKNYRTHSFEWHCSLMVEIVRNCEENILFWRVWSAELGTYFQMKSQKISFNRKLNSRLLIFSNPLDRMRDSKKKVFSSIFVTILHILSTKIISTISRDTPQMWAHYKEKISNDNIQNTYIDHIPK